jgi:hypothetical protein
MHKFEMESKPADIEDGIVPVSPSGSKGVVNLVGDVEGNFTDVEVAVEMAERGNGRSSRILKSLKKSL